MYKKDQKGILLCYHGSKSIKGMLDTQRFTKIFKKNNKNCIIKHGYLEIAKPTILNQIKNLAKNNISEIKIVPVMIFSGNHVKKDIPKIITTFKKNNKSSINFSYTTPLSQKNNFINLVQENIKKKIKDLKKRNICLVVLASNTINLKAKQQMATIGKKIKTFYNLTNYKVLMVGADKLIIRKHLSNLSNNYRSTDFLLLPIFLFRGRLLSSCIETAQQLNKNTKQFYVLPHFNNYEKITKLLI